MENAKIKKLLNECLNCKNKPCAIEGCPLNNDIPAFIKAFKNNNLKEAYRIISKTSVMPGICGRVCPKEGQCMGKCIRGIKGDSVSIKEIEQYIYDECKRKGINLVDVINKDEKKRKTKVAIIGGGPAGLTAAAFLAKSKIEVTIYEKHDYLGGLLSHGIPEYRLPNKIVKDTIEDIIKLGINIKYNCELSKNIFLEELKQEYDFVILAFGENKSRNLNIEGEKLYGVVGGNEFLEYKMQPDLKNKNVAIIGGGNVAIDCARVVKKMEAKNVKVIYRRNIEQMPAYKEEIEGTKKDGVEVLFQKNILKINGDKAIDSIRLIDTKLIYDSNSKRPYPINIENTETEIKIDYLIKALGATPDNFISQLGLTLQKSGKIKINENYQTSDSKVFAIGDLSNNIKTVAVACRTGRDVAEFIMNIINN